MPPVVAMSIFVLGIFAVIIVLLYLRHRNQQMLHEERLAALEKGTEVPPGAPRPWSTRVYLLRGLIWSFTGVALFICLLGLAWSSRVPEPAEQKASAAKYVSETLNIPLDQARQIVEKDEAENVRGMPPAVALLAIIPLGVGLAYLLFYWSDPSRRSGSEGRAS